MSYKNINLLTFALAGVVVSIPLIILQESNEDYAWSYVLLIAVSLLVFYYPQVDEFTRYLASKFKGL